MMLAIICDPPCDNGGICARGNNDQTMCHCPAGYSGEQCDKGKPLSCFIQQTNILFKVRRTYII